MRWYEAMAVRRIRNITVNPQTSQGREKRRRLNFVIILKDGIFDFIAEVLMVR